MSNLSNVLSATPKKDAVPGLHFPGPLRGVVPPMVTPLLDPDTLDIDGLERLIEHMLAGGVAGLFILGTTGEGPLLSYRLRRQLIETACRQVRSRVPVLVGISDPAFTESLSIARHAADCGAAAVVAAPPYYLPLGQPELSRYYDRLLDDLPLPLFLYNYPALTKCTIDPATVRRIMDHPRAAGIKDSSGNMIYFQRLLELGRTHPRWTVLAGPDELLGQTVLAGGHGGVNGGGNVFPQLYVACCDAALKKDLPRVQDLQSRVLKVTSSLYEVGRHGSAVIKGIKCALSLLGICGDTMAEPHEAFHEPERKRIAAALEELREIASVKRS